MDGSKLNKKMRDAAGKGAGRVAAGARGLWGKLRVWQKAGLILCLVSWIVSAVIGAVCARITGRMLDQNCASRWSPDRQSAQVSAFLSGSAGMSDETTLSLYAALMRSLQEDALTLSDTQIENGASLVDACYCGIGSADIAFGEESVTATMIGVGGDFFNFHPLDLMDGYYFSDDEIMEDRILLDDQTAWRLFGSPHIVGQYVDIGGTPHFIAGVFKRPEGRFYKFSGMGSYMVFISFDSLCKYTEVGAPAENGGDGGDTDDSSLNQESADAAPGTAADRMLAAGDGKIQEPGGGRDQSAAIPRTAAWQPVSKPVSDRGAGVTEKAAGTAVKQAAGQLSSVDAGNGLSGGTLLAAEDEGEDEAGEEESSGIGTPSAGAGTSQETDDKDAADEKDSKTDGEETDDEDADKPTSEDRGLNGGQNGKGSQSGNSDTQEKQEINRNRVSCYEAILPDPVSGYALRTIQKCMREAGVSMDQITVVENTSRYDTFRLASLVTQPGVRSMQTAAIRYPYWENVALAWEDMLIPYALLQLVLRFAPIVFLLFLLL
ncbi:MAG: ABC transporter permease, partial [Lachnospiraceae bacterium]|nr:ABC transporter permease [Lachnospiraceae bacterium]